MRTLFSSTANLMMSSRFWYDRHCPVGFPAQQVHLVLKEPAQCIRQCTWQQSQSRCKFSMNPLSRSVAGGFRLPPGTSLPLPHPRYCRTLLLQCKAAGEVCRDSHVQRCRGGDEEGPGSTWVDEDQCAHSDALCACISHPLLDIRDVHAPTSLLLQIVTHQLTTCTQQDLPPSLPCTLNLARSPQNIPLQATIAPCRKK